jgi:hypothetical protein
MLKKLFDTIKGTNNITTSELIISFKLLENKKYLTKISNSFKNTNKYLFIDFNDCFTFYLNNFLKDGLKNVIYFYNIINNRFTSTNLINTNSLFVNDFESTKIIELINLPNIGAPIDYENDIILYDNLEFNQNLIDIYSSVINLVINTIDTNIYNDIANNFLPTVVDNLTKIKLVINDLPEYNDLKTIFNTTGEECIKIDYDDPNFINNIDKGGQRNEYLKVLKK